MQYRYNDGGRALAGYKPNARDCVARAIAIATEQPYQAVYDALNQLEQTTPRRTIKRGSARNGINKDITRAYLASIGWTFTPTMGIGSGCTVHLRDGELPTSGRLIVKLSGHVCAVINGTIHDTHDPSRNGTRCVYGYWQKGSDQ